MAKYIRYDNYFVVKKGSKYFTTTVKDLPEWKDMNQKQKVRCIKKDVTNKVKELVKRVGTAKNIHLRTKSKRRVKKTKMKNTKKKKTLKKGSS